MIVEIALGIVLAVVILACLPALIALGVWVVGLALAIGAIVGVGALLFYGWNHTNAEELQPFIVMILGVGGFSFVALQIEKRTKMGSPEFVGLCFSMPGTIYVGYLLVDALTSSPRNDDAIGPLSFGFICGAGLTGYIVRNVARRYRTP